MCIKQNNSSTARPSISIACTCLIRLWPQIVFFCLFWLWVQTTMPTRWPSTPPLDHQVLQQRFVPQWHLLQVHGSMAPMALGFGTPVTKVHLTMGFTVQGLVQCWLGTPMAAFGPRVFYWWCDHYESAGHLHHLCDPQSHQLSSPNAQPTAAAWFMEEGAHSEVLVLAAKKEANSIWPYGMCRESITWTLQCNRCSILCAVLFGMFAGLGKIPQKALTKTAGQKNYENLGNQTIGQPNTDVSSLSR